MSFDVGPIRQPMIQSSQRMQNNGGGGNLGYMHQGKKKKNQEQQSEESFLEKEDSIQLSTDDLLIDKDSSNEDISQWIKNTAKKIAGKIIKKSNNPFKNA